MGVLDANPPLPEFRDDYVLQEVDREWLSKAVKPKQFIHIDQSECIMCEGALTYAHGNVYTWFKLEL